MTASKEKWKESQSMPDLITEESIPRKSTFILEVSKSLNCVAYHLKEATYILHSHIQWGDVETVHFFFLSIFPPDTTQSQPHSFDCLVQDSDAVNTAS